MPNRSSKAVLPFTESDTNTAALPLTRSDKTGEEEDEEEDSEDQEASSGDSQTDSALARRVPSEDLEGCESCRRRAALCRSWKFGVGACVLTTLVLLGAAAMLLLPGMQFQPPTWEVKSLVIDRVDLPALSLEGVQPADTTKCPTSDPCGLAQAQGCSRCPQAGMLNDGCVCQPGEGSGEGPKPGSIVMADTSACPLFDKCGTLSGVQCSRCPDTSWVNDGCTCRQPISTNQFFKGLGGFLKLLTGNATSLIKMSMRATVEVRNPNHIGAQTEAGHFRVHYKGAAIGSAVTEPQDIGACGAQQMNVSVAVDGVPASVAMRMMQELLQTTQQLSISVEGQVMARTGFLRVLCRVECDLQVNAAEMPATRFSRRACAYSYDF